MPTKFAAKKLYCLLVFAGLLFAANGQRSKADSLKEALRTEAVDSNRARMLWQLAFQVDMYNPDTALKLSQEALYLSKKINYEEGQSRALGVLANVFNKLGNYPRALELNIQKLQLDEKRNNPRNLASVLMNIGAIYVMQEEFGKAITYYRQSDSVISLYNIANLKYYIDLNLGDVYNRLDQSDSAYHYFNRSLQIAREIPDDDFIGTSMTGLGHSFLKMGKTDSSLYNYRTAIAYLRSVNDDDILTEAALGLANLFRQEKQYDSSKFYATESYSIAKKLGFLSKELEAAEFLTEHYSLTKNIDSAFTYIQYVKALNDSVNSRNRIRELQMISSNEQFRQNEIEENNRLAKKERQQRLQLLFIGIFIPGFFLMTLFLSRVKVHIKLIRVLGVLSLLFFFEYITILLHPAVAKMTNHNAWLEILIFVAVGAILVPTHHRLELWLIEKLMLRRIKHDIPVTGNEPIVITDETLVGVPVDKEEEVIAAEATEFIELSDESISPEEPEKDEEVMKDPPV